MIVVDEFLTHTPGPQYNCFDFVRNVRKADTGVDIGDRLQLLRGTFSTRKATVSGLRGWPRLAAPVDGCFVVMQRPRTVPHIGVWVRGKVLHLGATGAQHDKLQNVTRRYKKVVYFA